jgi:hypothetical protein
MFAEHTNYLYLGSLCKFDLAYEIFLHILKVKLFKGEYPGFNGVPNNRSGC